jgi:hypothetical protein
MMYIIQGLYALMRFYKKFYRDGAIMDIGVFADLPYLSVPVGVTRRLMMQVGIFCWNWAHKHGNVVVMGIHHFGSHFAVHGTPYSLDDCAVLAKEYLGSWELSKHESIKSL